MVEVGEERERVVEKVKPSELTLKINFVNRCEIVTFYYFGG